MFSRRNFNFAHFKPYCVWWAAVHTWLPQPLCPLLPFLNDWCRAKKSASYLRCIVYSSFKFTTSTRMQNFAKLKLAIARAHGGIVSAIVGDDDDDWQCVRVRCTKIVFQKLWINIDMCRGMGSCMTRSRSAWQNFFFLLWCLNGCVRLVFYSTNAWNGRLHREKIWSYRIGYVVLLHRHALQHFLFKRYDINQKYFFSFILFYCFCSISG